MDLMKEIREQFGEEYSEENYKKMAQAYYYDPPLINIEHKPEQGCFIIGNDDIENNQSIVEINKILGLNDIPIDKVAIE